jgi:hypothetical protein
MIVCLWHFETFRNVCFSRRYWGQSGVRRETGKE